MGYFFVSGPFGGLKRVPRDVFGHTDLIGTYIFVGDAKIEFFQMGRGGGGGVA